MARMVTLSNTTWPKFPDMCVRCAKPSPSDTLDPVSHWLVQPEPRQLAGDPTTAHQPDCPLCKKLALAEVWPRRLVLLAAAGVILYGMAVYKQSETTPFVHTEYAYFVAGLILWLFLGFVIRSPLQITARRSKLQYRFRKNAVGAAFFKCNTLKR